MKSFEAEAMIYARSSTVWDIITDAGNFTVWASGITRIDGQVRNGGTIRIRTRTGGNRTFRLRVRQIPGEVMTWTGGLPLSLFTGVRTFTLSPQGGKTHLRVREDFSGPLIGLIGRAVPDMGQDCTGYVNAVKERAELIG
ncbi:SRPBCC domain-containing protein [Pseudarthrobacter sp. H2]|uniref:SRPBCC domain-containing protein n=1 Tax=Pseudarthrobacter sp. H2 TaxID=3418415 RepID=UPI003CF323E3